MRTARILTPLLIFAYLISSHGTHASTPSSPTQSARKTVVPKQVKRETTIPSWQRLIARESVKLVLIPLVLGSIVALEAGLVHVALDTDFIDEPFLLGCALSLVFYFFEGIKSVLYQSFLHLLRRALPEKIGEQKNQLGKQWVELTAEIISALIVALTVWLLRARIGLGLEKLELTFSLFFVAAVLIMSHFYDLISFFTNFVGELLTSLGSRSKTVTESGVVMEGVKLLLTMYANLQTGRFLGSIMAKKYESEGRYSIGEKAAIAKNIYYTIVLMINVYGLLSTIADAIFSPSKEIKAQAS